MHRSSARRSLAAVAVAAAAVFAGTASASAALSRMPLANRPIATLPATCDSAPTGRACTDAVIAALDGARAALGLGPYMLPAGFDSMPPTRQLFVLANLDRTAYGLPPIAGISPALAGATASAMRSDVDPDPTSLLASLPSYAWTADWAGGWANAAYAYYEWMYDDGYGGAETSNVDCTSDGASGCWDHRRNILAFAGAGSIAMGVSAGVDAHGQPSYAITLVWTPSNAWTGYSYSWAQAQAAGAGAPRGSKLRQSRKS